MAAPSLVSRAEGLSAQIKEALRLLPSDDPLQLASKPKPAASFLFEMLVLHELVVALKSAGWTVEAVTRAGEHKFPRAPAAKANHS
jgi:hypothetical protein